MIGINYQQMSSIAARLTLLNIGLIVTLGTLEEFNKLQLFSRLRAFFSVFLFICFLPFLI